MPDTHLCSGCDSTFSLRGYQSHLLQTKDPLCRAVFDGLKKSYETYQLLEKATNSSDEPMEDTNDLDINMDRDWAEENQNPEASQLDDDGHHDDESVLGDIGDMAAEWETGWEEPREGAPQEDNAEDELADIRWTPQITTRKNQTRTMTPNTILIVTLSGMDTELNQLSEYAIQINILPHMRENLYLAATLKTSFTVHHLVVGTTLGLRFFLRKTGKWHVGQSFEELDRQPFLTSLPLMV